MRSVHMKRENREQFSTQHILQQYDELLACEKLGYYNSCEMISVFIFSLFEIVYPLKTSL